MRSFCALGGLALALAACGGDTINVGRADSGVPASDGGLGAPLAYTVGMHFSYTARLTYRSSTGEESSSAFDLALTVTAVDDQGARAESTITITAAGQQGLTQNWNPTAGYDAWIDRLGPADDADRVSPNPLVVHLARAPRLPSAAPGKTIPNDGIYFLDLRRAEAIKSDFSTVITQAGLMPRFVDPSQNLKMRWILGLSGHDDSIQYGYSTAVKKRDLDLEYDPRGWLVHAEERIGDSAMPNTATGNFMLDLKAGP